MASRSGNGHDSIVFFGPVGRLRPNWEALKDPAGRGSSLWGSFHCPCRPKLAITLSRKDWHSYANRAVVRSEREAHASGCQLATSFMVENAITQLLPRVS